MTDANPIDTLHGDHVLLEAAFELIGTGLCFLDDAGRFLHVNDAFCRMLGRRREDIIGQPWTAAAPPQVAAQGARFLNALFGESPRLPDEWQVRRSDGSLLTVLISFKSIRLASGARRLFLTFTDIERRKAAQQNALRRSQNLYRDVVENVSEGIIVTQGERLIYVNPCVVAMSGYSSEELLALPFSALVHPDDMPGMMDRYRRRMEGLPAERHGLFRIVRKDRELIWIESSAVRIEWEGQPAMLAFLSDQTERRRQEAALIESEEHHRQVVNNATEGILVTQGDRVVFANDRFRQLTGRASNQMIGQSFLSDIHPDDRPLVTERHVRRVRGEAVESTAQFRVLHRHSGRVAWVEVSSVTIDWEGKPATLSFINDITTRKQLEDQLKQSLAERETILENSIVGIVFLNAAGRVHWANSAAFEIFRIDPIEPIGKSLESYYPSRESYLRTGAAVAEAVSKGKAFEEELQMRRGDGELFWAWLSGRAVTPNDLSRGTVWVVMDITKRRQLEEELELARREAEETTRAKSMFLANMSHEIRTPMNAIIGMAHLALRTALDARQRDYIEKIRGAGISLLGIINDILDFSKIEAGRLDMEYVDFHLDDVLGNVAAVTGERAHEKGLEYLFHFPLDIPRGLVGDPLRLGQVLINLINNAIKFTERGEVHVSCCRLDSGARKIQLQFMVRDTGIGMTREQTARLFRAFSQADESTTRKYGGTGLGLSIAKRLVELMGGTIWLDSEPGVGTTIRFTAWFGLAKAQARRRSAQVAPMAIAGLRVLVVDDNPSARLVLSDSLSVLPLQVETAASAEQALALILAADRERPYGVVFTDLQMPGMDGIDLIEAVRDDRSLVAPPRMVLLSAHSREEARYRIDNAQADAFLVKPVSASMLVDTLVELFAPAPRGALPDAVEAIPRFRDLAILLVEDNDINRQIAVELMEAAGIRVDTAGNGRIAVDMLMQAGPERYGMVFMDVQMPEMDGHEATRRIRADPRFDALPVIAMTAHAMVEERERCFESGMNDHLAKPVNPAQLYHAVGHWCPNHLVEMQPAESVMDAPDTDEPELLIDGVDVQGGLARALGNRAFYMQMLARFREGQRETVADIRAALDRDRVLAERLAHTLRGVAGMLGAGAVQRHAGVLEAEIRGGADSAALRPLLDELAAAMRVLQAALDRVLPAPSPAAVTPAAAVDREQAQLLLDRLAGLLGDYDGEAVDLLADAASLLAAALGTDAFHCIDQALQRYDFDAALLLVNESARAAGYIL